MKDQFLNHCAIVLTFLLSVLSTVTLKAYAPNQQSRLSGCSAPDSLRSLAFKGAVPFPQFPVVSIENSYSKLGDVVALINKANSGNVLAQHELGILFLTGQNFPADTLKAAYWIRRSAENNLLSARYNLGILQYNGWGVPWNPFEAYRNFKRAAQKGMPEAQYVYGLFFIDNLVVGKNYGEAYRWLAISAGAGYDPAKKMLEEFKKKGIVSTTNAEKKHEPDQKNRSSSSASRTSVLSVSQTASVDSSSDTVRGPEDKDLLKEALLEYRTHVKKGSTPSDPDTTVEEILSELEGLFFAAQTGCPEALTLMGRWHEKGNFLKKDDGLAAVCYLRAIRNDSPRAPLLLWKLVQKDGYFDALKARVVKNDPVAKFVWADLVASGFDRQLSETGVISFFNDAAQEFDEAMVELGLMHYSGKWVSRDREKGKQLLKQAADAGHREAKVRLWMIELGEGECAESAALVDSLRQTVDDGSLFAEAMLGYCYQKGIGVSRNIPKSVHYYRMAAERGCRSARNALKELHDEIRPEDPEFKVDD